MPFETNRIDHFFLIIDSIDIEIVSFNLKEKKSITIDILLDLVSAIILPLHIEICINLIDMYINRYLYYSDEVTK